MNKRDTGQSDAELVAEANAGHDGAFALLYERYRPSLRAFCRRMVRDHARAEDIVQDTYVKARAALIALRSTSSVRSWLFHIARNEALMILRNEKRTQATDEEPIDDATPLDSLIEMETTDAVRRLLDALKPEYREVLILREYEEMRYDEIAKVTDSSVQSVKSKIFKARKALAARLKALYAERRHP